MPQLSLHFLGTGTIAPDPARSCSATLLDTPAGRILVDIGTGTFRRMAEYRIDVQSIDHIFITHFHPDHIGDLANYLFVYRARQRVVKRPRPLQVWGPPGLNDFMNYQAMAYGSWLPLEAEDGQVRELNGEEMYFSGLHARWAKTIHTPESICYRFEYNGSSLVFSGDSDYCPELVEICREADLALLECAYSDANPAKGHLTPERVGRIAAESGVKRILLNHLYPETRASDPLGTIRRQFAGRVQLVDDGEVIHL